MTSIWQISREYAGLAEAGGVKNVVTSLCEQLVTLDNQVTLFIPLYGCTAISAVQNFEIVPDTASAITVADKNYIVFYGNASIGKVKIVFVVSTLFTEKMGVYTYTALEEKLCPTHVRGQGHQDAATLEIMFQKAVLWYGVLKNEMPDIIHCHDATTAMIPFFARNCEDFKSAYKNTRFVCTIHNAGPFYHHEIDSVECASSLTGLPADVLKVGLNPEHLQSAEDSAKEIVEPYLLAATCSVMTTVSPWYAEELMDPDNAFTDGLSKGFSAVGTVITGITNGLDYEKYNPTDCSKSQLPFAYDPETLNLEGKWQCRRQFAETYSVSKPKITGIVPDIPHGEDMLTQFGGLDSQDAGVWFSYHGRLASQKGLDVLIKSIPLVLKRCPQARFIITGQGETEIEKALQTIAEEYTGKCLYLRGYNRSMARLGVAAADFIILPSWFEPCGLEDFIAAFLGTIPVAHATGGLKKIADTSTGFLYEPNDPSVLADTLVSLAQKKEADSHVFDRIIQNAAVTVHAEYSWEEVVKKQYVPLYETLLEKN